MTFLIIVGLIYAYGVNPKDLSSVKVPEVEKRCLQIGCYIELTTIDGDEIFSLASPHVYESALKLSYLVSNVVFKRQWTAAP